MDVYVAVRGFEHEGAEPIGAATTMEAAQAICAEDYAADELADDWPDEGPLVWADMRLVRGSSTQSVRMSQFYEVRILELRDVPVEVA